MGSYYDKVMMGCGVMRKIGVYFPLSCLPSYHGIGDMGYQALRFLNLLQEYAISIWHLSPLHPENTESGYFYSVFAKDPIYISLDMLVEDGLLKKYELRKFHQFHTLIDVEAIRIFKEDYFQKAYKRFQKDSQHQQRYGKFCEEAKEWLHAYAKFMMLKKEKQGVIRDYDEKEVIGYEQFLQYILYRQWKQIKSYANCKGVQIVVDVTFGIGMDSADVWQNPSLFVLNPKVYVSNFSKDKTCHNYVYYQWYQLRKQQYVYWSARFKWMLKYYDGIQCKGLSYALTYPVIHKEIEWKIAPIYDVFDKMLQNFERVFMMVEDDKCFSSQLAMLQRLYDVRKAWVCTLDNVRQVCKNNTILFTSTLNSGSMEAQYRTFTNNQKIAIRRYLQHKGYQDRKYSSKGVALCLHSEAEVVIVAIWDLMGKVVKAQSEIGICRQWKVKRFDEIRQCFVQLLEIEKSTL